VAVQFITAGAAIGGLGNSGDFDVHEMAAGATHLWLLLMIIAAAVGKLGRRLIIIAVALFVLVTIQFMLPDASDGLAALHPLNALIIAFGAYHAMLAARAGEPAARAPEPAA
jgi:hypothetical protein